MKFTIRDLFLVTMIVALAVGWWVNRRQFVTQCEKSEQQGVDATVEAGDWKFKATSLAKTMQDGGWKIDMSRDHAIYLIGPPDSPAPATNPSKQ